MKELAEYIANKTVSYYKAHIPADEFSLIIAEAISSFEAKTGKKVIVQEKENFKSFCDGCKTVHDIRMSCPDAAYPVKE